MCNQKSFRRQTKGYKAKCITRWCRRPRAKGRYCYRCETENKKRNNPIRYWYNVNKANANRRARQFGTGKYWYVSFEYWEQFCNESGYLILKGRTRDEMTLDCIKNELGYVDGNLQLLTNSENASKGTKNVVWNYLTNTWEVVEQNFAAVYDDLPF